MGRPPLGVKTTVVRLPNGLAERIDDLIGPNRRAHEPHNSAATLQITMSQELVNGGMRENYRRIGKLPDNRSRKLLSG